MATEPDTPILIEFRNLTKKFGHFTAVNNVSLSIHKGEIMGFLGPNGAGKSTTMKMMAYLLRPTEGQILIRTNGNLEALSEHNRDYLLDNIGFLIENPAFYENVTPREVLSYFAKLKGYPREKINKRVEEIISRMGLTDWIDKKLKTFSKGMRQKIGILSAIVHDPEIIVLDEPYTGLDPRARKEVRDFILELKQQGKTIFLSSHLLFEVSEVADRVAIINHGELIACDTLDNLEMAAKHSIIRLEILNPPALNEWNKKVQELQSFVVEIIPKEDIPFLKIKYNPQTQIFEIPFNGEPELQHKILSHLINKGVKVIEYSVPKATLLEDLYMELVQESDKTATTNGPSAITIENVL